MSALICEVVYRGIFQKKLAATGYVNRFMHTPHITGCKFWQSL